MSHSPQLSSSNCVENATVRITREEDIHLFINESYVGSVDFLMLNGLNELYFPPRGSTRLLEGVTVESTQNIEQVGLVAHISGVQNPNDFRSFGEFLDEMESTWDPFIVKAVHKTKSILERIIP